MKLAVVGSRGFNDYDLLAKEIDAIRKDKNITTIVSGGADGADALAEKYAIENGLGIIVITPEWNKYGRRAGYIRNVKIWDSSNLGIAFWDGESKGTQHSFKISREQNKECIICNFTKN